MDSTNPSELSFYIVFESYNSFILFLNLMILLYCFRTYESFNQKILLLWLRNLVHIEGRNLAIR